MHVCGQWLYLPFYKDHVVALPLQWQAWINDAPARDGDNDGDDDGDDSGDKTKQNDWEDINNNDKDNGKDDDNNDEIGEDMANTIGPEHDFQSNSYLGSSSKTMQSSKTKRTRSKASTQIKRPPDLIMTFNNPFTNPSELEAIMRSSRQQPNWKAAEMEGESWEGTAEENMEKYKRIMNPPPVDWPKVISNLTGSGGD